MQLSTTFITSRKFVYLLQCSAVDIQTHSFTKQTVPASLPAVGKYHLRLTHLWLFFLSVIKGLTSQPIINMPEKLVEIKQQYLSFKVKCVSDSRCCWIISNFYQPYRVSHKKLYLVLEGRSTPKFWARNEIQGCFRILRFSALKCIIIAFL